MNDEPQMNWLENYKPYTPSGLISPDADVDTIKAVAYCAIGGPRPQFDDSFQRAKAKGLLAQDPVWRPTERGLGALIAHGYMCGNPAPEEAHIVALWATCERFPKAQFVAAWSDGYVDCFSRSYERERTEAEANWRSFGDEQDWRFFTTTVGLSRPEVPERTTSFVSDRLDQSEAEPYYCAVVEYGTPRCTTTCTRFLHGGRHCGDERPAMRRGKAPIEEVGHGRRASGPIRG